MPWHTRHTQGRQAWTLKASKTLRSNRPFNTNELLTRCFLKKPILNFHKLIVFILLRFCGHAIGKKIVKISEFRIFFCESSGYHQLTDLESFRRVVSYLPDFSNAALARSMHLTSSSDDSNSTYSVQFPFTDFEMFTKTD